MNHLREFNRVLIANRGEISVRIIKALKSLGIESVAVYSDADTSALHVTMADMSFRLPGFSASETYLNAEKIIEIARRSDCDAVHPGYGFLSEKSDFAKLCEENSIKFVGPSSSTLAISGNKLECKKLVEANGVPVVEYTREPMGDPQEAARTAEELGFPVLLKSAYGGGGRGIREARNKQEVKDAFEASERESKSSFGRFSIYLEKKLVNPRHLEIQIVASDDSQDFVHLGERECSIQRRYQKLIELSPSPILNRESRKEISSYALKAAQAVKYSNLGTIEFLRDSATGKFYFLEINSRLQVEHPVTEFITGIDLVATQFEIASRNKMAFRQKDVHFNGCALECRINAEDPATGFSPTTGKIGFLSIPSGPGIRVDSALQEEMEISPFYDSMIAKLVVHGSNLDQVRRRAQVALNEFTVYGIETTIPFHQEVMRDEYFARGDIDTGFIESRKLLDKLTKASEMAEDHQFMIASLLLSRNQFAKAWDIPKQTRRAQLLHANSRENGRFVDAI